MYFPQASHHMEHVKSRALFVLGPEESQYHSTLEALALGNQIICRNVEIRKHSKENFFDKDSKESFGIYRNIHFFGPENFKIT